ncbi:energy transducer TonB [Hymenobacter terrenus]|uniref:energy transducer TonB n=1 Tax=Hymenobacter terrenus TaxID=1629124 RepID=UPI0018CD74B7|nr:energy transducer TonB [Hymenobacter terrenus]
MFLALAFTSNAQKLHSTKWESGMMDRRNKVGVWEYYGITASKEMVVVQRYDHTTQKLLYFRPVGEKTYNVEIAPGQWQRRAVDQPPMFIGGDAALAVYTTQMQYPQRAQDNNIQGAVTITFAVDTLGRINRHRVLRGIGGGCDEEAMRVARSIPNEWIPAKIGNQSVLTEYELTLTFRLAKP